jgi:Zn-finger nucleic acid-binding protein
MNQLCPICDSELTSPKLPEGQRDAAEFDCPRCGKYRLSGTLEAAMPELRRQDSDAGTKLRYFFSSADSENNPIELNTQTVQEILKKPLPRPGEQADILIRWLARNVRAPGERKCLDPRRHRAVIGAKTAAGFSMVLDHLIKKGFVDRAVLGRPGEQVYAGETLTFEGWEYFESLRVTSKPYRKAFMAMKFGDADLNDMLENVFKPASKEAGFELFKLDDSSVAGLIDDRMRVEIQTSDFVVADLTHDNLGAYWEAGYAEGLGKPVIYTCEKKKFFSTPPHFDTNHHLTIIWCKDEAAIAGRQLTATIRATFPALALQSAADV